MNDDQLISAIKTIEQSVAPAGAKVLVFFVVDTPGNPTYGPDYVPPTRSVHWIASQGLKAALRDDITDDVREISEGQVTEHAERVAQALIEACPANPPMLMKGHKATPTPTKRKR